MQVALDVDVEELFRIVRDDLLRGRIPSLDLLYGVSQTRDNEGSVLPLLAAHRGIVGISGVQSNTLGYPGCAVWARELLNSGVKPGQLVLVDGGLSVQGGVEVFHTLSEAEALVAYAKQKGLKTIGVVAPAYHLTRVMMSMVLAINQDYPALRVYPTMGEHQDLNEWVMHSQGTLGCRRGLLFMHEAARIYRYRTQGNLPSQEEFVAYLARRDAA